MQDFHLRKSHFGWEKSSSFLIRCYDYIKEWKKKDSAEKIYEKIISEMLQIVDHAYKKKVGGVLPIISTLINDAQNFLPTLKHLPIPEQVKNKSLKELFDSLVHRVIPSTVKFVCYLFLDKMMLPT